MPRYALTVYFLAIVLSPVPAFAGSVIQRSSPGLDCYEATLLEPSPLHDQQAISICDKAVDEISDNRNLAATLVNRADIRLRLKDFQGAVNDSQRAIAVNPDIAVAYLNLGAGLVGLKRYEEAIPSLDRAISMGAGQPQLVYYNRAIAKESLGDIDGAYHDYKSAVDLDQTFVLASDQLSRFKVTAR